MDKQAYAKGLEKLNLPKSEFIILSGGSLLMHGLRETTADFDNFKFDIIDGYQCESLEGILAFKKKANRLKDQQDIIIYSLQRSI